MVKLHQLLAQCSSRQIENIAIVVIWILVLVWPLGIAYFLYASQGISYDEERLSDIYLYIIAFLVLFLLHHYVVMPYVYPRKKGWFTALSLIILLGGFATFLKLNEPDDIVVIPIRDKEQRGDFPPPHKDPDHRPEFRDGEQHPRPNDHRPRPQRHRIHEQRILLDPPDMARMIIALLMLGADIGIFAMLQANTQRKRLLQLEQQNLKQELDNLKHQINPHFFMNTLNNIHALIDIDQELAKRSVIELSQMMRYMLYDGTGSTVALPREVDYIERYISLMKLRYDEKVEIVCQLDSNHNEVQIPPLLLVTFVENAFKHGVSYREHSFIYVNLELIDGGNYLHFACTNSRHNVSEKTEGGIGLENVRKRLELLYPDRKYELTIDEHNPLQFAVRLTLPIE